MVTGGAFYGWGYTSSEDCAWDQAPSFSTDLNAVRQAEDELEKRGLRTAYAREFKRLMNCLDGDVEYALYASAKNKCRAILLTLAQKEGR